MEKKIAKFSFLCLSSLLLSALVALGVVRAREISLVVWDNLSARFSDTAETLLYGKQEAKLIEIDPNSRPIQDMIAEASDTYGIPQPIIEAIIHVESGKKLNPRRVRFEPRIFANLKPLQGEQEIEKRMRASSHGLMQVMGYNAPLCGLEWPDLYQPKQNIFCGLKILSNCLQRHTGKDAGEQLTKALGCYNGDPVGYPVKVRIALADLVVDRLPALLLKAEKNLNKSVG